MIELEFERSSVLACAGGGEPMARMLQQLDCIIEISQRFTITALYLLIFMMQILILSDFWGRKVLRG